MEGSSGLCSQSLLLWLCRYSFKPGSTVIQRFLMFGRRKDANLYCGASRAVPLPEENIGSPTDMILCQKMLEKAVLPAVTTVVAEVKKPFLS